MAKLECGTCLRCHHCAGPLSKEMETSDWTVRPLIRDSFSMIGSAVGGTTSAFYGFNHVMPIVQKWIKGPMRVHFLIGAPPVIVFSSACAGLAGIPHLLRSRIRNPIHQEGVQAPMGNLKCVKHQ
ncbi:uncharacterized protein LOC131146217 isoform X2 [Malania oleifera]|uniref:uncharacterized protein LOC131146217 isoform X2 n=1 Tax=Malania oleifera TaxID=397392 RepID=UPI0025AE4648|nr:uncharacterized protein LOC131146217 isoform X2 [Malania oleifera]XP_057951628.1 uncharacterized protein LOC131146217 isoform X2 [Malania oleifera]